MTATARPLAILLAAALASGCGDRSTADLSESVGPSPRLPEPTRTLFPTVEVAEAVGWPAGGAPTAAQGLRVNAFATGLDHPRWLLRLPNGDVLVAESAAPPRPEGTGGGIRGFFQRLFMGRAGSQVPSANRITLLRDADGDGTAELRTPYITGLASPIGMALVGDTLYVANADALVAFPYDPAATRIAAAPRRIADLPAGRNHHWTKTLAASPDGRRLYVGVGSNSNVGENGLDEERGRAAIWEIDPASGAHRIFASGLRNPVGVAFRPGSGDLYTVVNERDELGSDLVPDYLTRVQAGGFYGWPWSYWGHHVDTRVEPARPDLVGRAIRPDYALGNHVAPLGLSFSEGARLGPRFASGAFIGLHGSWNRNPPSGYKVVFVPFANGRPAGMPVDVLTGFRSGDGRALGRPVGVQIGRDGSLLVADDVGNTIWRVSAR
ncbi:sorbosone dehydrogenase family protein [Sphingosinicella sp. LHD-64]|uniref:PQQ-dependent sugar dehydrogenase n=1 Tax=Sphingosinicella sp. LHD-64 TaxID=3072139 RepID=UPI00280D9152|nr:sorbosone dehydrogenase family protein [Sphingosinicella sp. LHD-64]MDQ8758311.1 sorbosone dehydrogenase family protein [Sphingosinicella sp. LHD-64]